MNCLIVNYKFAYKMNNSCCASPSAIFRSIGACMIYANRKRNTNGPGLIYLHSISSITSRHILDSRARSLARVDSIIQAARLKYSAARGPFFPLLGEPPPHKFPGEANKLIRTPWCGTDIAYPPFGNCFEPRGIPCAIIEAELSRGGGA